MGPKATRWSWKGWIGAGAAIVGLGLAGRYLLTPHDRGIAQTQLRVEPSAVPVTVALVKQCAIRRSISAVGSLWGLEEIALTPKVEGRIVKIHHDVGDVVRPGETLLEIDTTDAALAVAEARRALELELVRLDVKKLPDEKFDVAALPSVMKAAAQERHAAARRDRYRQLASSRAASQEDVQQADADHAVMSASYRQSVIDAAATLATARQRQAALDSALQRLGDTRVVVPGLVGAAKGTVEYVICQRSVSEGEIVRIMPGASNTLFRLVIDRPLKLRPTIPERHRALVKVGLDAELEVEAFPGEKFHGKVARVNPSIDRASRTFQVEVLVANDDRRLSPGSFAKVALLASVDPSARAVPEEAIVSFAGVTKVFTVRDGKAREVKVRLGATAPIESTDRVWIELDGDLPVGAPVVTSGQSQLADGTPVRLRSAEDAQ